MTQRTVLFCVCIISLALIGSFGVAQGCMWFTLGAKDGSVLVGRTMEFGVPLKWQIVVAPRNMGFQEQSPRRKTRDKLENQIWLCWVLWGWAGRSCS